jgi:hypothetical protein
MQTIITKKGMELLRKNIKMFTGKAWVGDQFTDVTYIKAKDCDFNKENFISFLQKDVPEVALDSEICEIYMRYNVGYSHEYGDTGFYGESQKGVRGASLYYYAKIKYKPSIRK